MRILVTGSNGFVGSFLCEELCRRGHEVDALVRPGSSVRWLEGLPVRIVPGDLSLSSLEATTEGKEVVFHVAGLTRAWKRSGFEEVNTGGTRSLVDALLGGNRLPRRVILVSSLAAVGPSPDASPLDESAPCSPVTPYGTSKLHGEWEFRRLPEKVGTVIRPPIVYGPRDTGLLSVFVAVARGLAPVLGRRERFYSMIHAQDLARGIADAAEADAAAGGTYFLTDGVVRSWDEVLDAIRAAVRPGARRLVIPLPLVAAAAALSGAMAYLRRRGTFLDLRKLPEILAPAWTCSGDKALQDIGFSARRGLREGMVETAGWYRKEGWIPDRSR